MEVKMKRRISLLLAAVLVMLSISVTPLNVFASEVSEEPETEQNEGGEADAEGSEAAGSEGEGAESGTVMENGQVVMEGAVGKLDESEWITIEDYEVIAESDTYKMYFYEPRLSIMLENKKTGQILESTLSDEKDDGDSNASWNAYMKSGIVISAIKGTNNTYQVDLISSENTIDVTYTDNGFSAKIYFPTWKFGLTLNVSLEDDELVVNVPDDSIIEEGEGMYISTISLYPFMGYSFLGDVAGYMLVPDGNGALIYLDDKDGKYTTGFSQMIYGTDKGFDEAATESFLWDDYKTVISANQVIAPIFGMVHTEEQQGYLAVVEQGDQRATIEAQPNGALVNYNRCFAKFLLRDIFTQPLNNSSSGTVTAVESDRTHMDLQVRYMLLQGEDADYSGMAVKYREYLLDNGMLSAKDVSYNTRVDFLGTDREEWLVSTRAVTMTTVDQIEEIYDDLKNDGGIDSLLSIYKGWQKGGLYNVPITKYKADSKIGGTSALTDLIQEAGEDNYQLYLYNDALRANPDETNTTFNVIKKVNKRVFEEYEYSQVYDTFLYLTPSRTNKVLDKFLSSYTKKGVENLALSGISNTLFSYSYSGEYYTRLDCANDYTEAVSNASENTNLVLEQPFAYLWNYTNAFLDMPLGSSDYMYVDEEIPFLSMVLKGVIPMYSDYVNFEANKQEFFLQMVESGVYPSFYVTYENSADLIYTNSANLYSTEYSTYRDTIIEYDEKLREVAAAVDGAVIINHERMDNGITAVSYDNGVTIYVNYTDKAATVDGYEVEAMSYKVGETK